MLGEPYSLDDKIICNNFGKLLSLNLILELRIYQHLKTVSPTFYSYCIYRISLNEFPETKSIFITEKPIPKIE